MTSLKPKRLIGVGLILSLSLTNGLALSLLSTKTAYAAPNYQINYQGKLADSSGTAVADGSYSIVFNLYTASSGGTAIWTESHTGANKVSVTSGLFSTMLGSITSLSTVDFNQTLYLGVTVESDSEMTPRKILGAVPAAFQADKLDGLDSTDFISTSTSALTKVWSSTGLGQIGSTTATTTFLGNLAAVGTTVLNGILSVYQNVTAPYFTATSTSVASTFPYASTTAISATTASSTNLIASTAATFSFLGSGLTKVTNGALGLATAGTDYLTSAFQSWQLSGGYLTPTTTQVVKVDGLISTASSTFNGDLNIVGNATATNATTTNLAVTSQASTSQLTVSKSATFTFLGSGLTKLTSGVLSLATAGTDYLTSAFQSWQLSGGYLTPTTTQTVLLNNGFISTASSTVSGLLTVNYASTTAVSSTATSTFGAVGVGTSLPSSLLSINNGASYQRTKGLQITDGSKSGYFYQFSSAGTYSLQSGGDLIFEVNGANEAARLVGTNKFLGVGTSSPYARLSVVGQTVSEYFTATSTTQASTFPYASTTALSATSICLTGDTCRTTWPTGGSSFGQAWEIVSGYLTPTTTQTVLLNNGFVSTASSTVSGLLTTTYSSTTALTVSGTGSALIVSSGNVGIGTTSPSRNFVLSGTNPFLRVNNDSTGNSVFELSINGTSKSFLGTAGSSNGLVTGSSAGDTVLRTQGQNLLFTTDSGTTAHMVINTSGYVGIGTASPTAKLHVAGNIYSSGTISGSSLVGNTFNAVAANNTGFSAGNTEAAGALNAYMFRQNIGGDTTYGMNYATVLSNDAYYNGTNWIRRNQYTQPVILTLGGDGANTGIFRVMYGGFGAGSDERFTPTELFRVNSSGYMGIGTSTPNSHLSIYDSGNTAAGQRIELGYNSSFNYIFGRNPTTGLMDFTGTNTGGSQYIGYTFNGKVGVGTTTPQGRLVLGNTIYIDDTSAGASIPSRGTIGGANLAIGLLTGGPYLQTYASQPLLLNPGGNSLGIGTSSPLHTLDIVNSSTAASTTCIGNGVETDLCLGNNGQVGYRRKTGTGLGLDFFTDVTASGAGGFIAFRPQGLETLRLTNAGLVGISTSSPSYLTSIGGASSQTSPSLFIGSSAVGNTSFIPKIQLEAKDSSGNAYDWAILVGRSPLGTLSFANVNTGTQPLTIGTNDQVTMSYASTTVGTITTNAYFPGTGVWNSSGNVGINTASPSAMLHITSTNGAANTAKIIVQEARGAGNDASIQLTTTNNSNDAYIQYTRSGAGSWVEGSDGSDSNSFKIDRSTSLTTAAPFTILTGGNIGVASNTPGMILGVTGNQLLNGQLVIDAAQNTNGNIKFTASQPYISASSYITIPGGAFFSSGSTYFASAIRARGGVANDTGATLSITGGTSGYTNFTGKVGVGTTTPGTDLSLGNTGNSTVNLSSTATSTFGFGINLRGGCFAINGTCISGSGGGSGTVNSGTVGGLAYYTGSTAVSSGGLSLYFDTGGTVTLLSVASSSASGGLVARYINSSVSTSGGYLNNATNTYISSGRHDTSLLTGSGDPAKDTYIGYGGQGGTDFIGSANGGAGGNVHLVWGGLTDGSGTIGADGGVTVGNPFGNKNATLTVYGDTKVMFKNTATTNGVCHSGTDLDTIDSTNTYTLVACSAAPGDIAEFYPTKTDVEVGDIVSTSDENLQYAAEGADPYTGQVKSLGTTTISVLKRANKGESGVLGIVSTGPYQTFGKDVRKTVPDAKPVALVGRVPVKVTLEGGDIRPGDRITLSSVPGVGMRASTSGMTIGVAISSFTAASPKDGNGIGKVNVFVNLSYAKLDNAINAGSINNDGFWTLDDTTGRIKAFSSLDLNNLDINNVRSIQSGSGDWSISSDGVLVVKEVHAQKLCLGQICISEAELKGLLDHAGLSAVGSVSNGGSNNSTTTTPSSSSDNTASSTSSSGGSSGSGGSSADNTPPADTPSTDTPPADTPIGDTPTNSTPPADTSTPAPDNASSSGTPAPTPDPAPAPAPDPTPPPTADPSPATP